MRIVKNFTNKVALTLSQETTNNDSEWIIEFVNVLSKESKVVCLEDISEFQERSNIFEIIENENEDLSNSVVSLSEGQYDYTVYEMAPSSPRNLDPDDAIKIVKEGILIVADESVEEDNSFSEDDNDTHGVFDA